MIMMKWLVLTANRRKQIRWLVRLPFIATRTGIKHVTLIGNGMKRKFHKQQLPSQFPAYSILFRLSGI